MKKIHSLIFTVLLALSSILQVAPVFADANSFYFKDLTIDYNLHKTSENTSEMEVTETFTTEFPNYNQNHGIERVIPFLNQNDTNLTMESADKLKIEVTRNGNPEPYTVKTNSTNFVVRIGNVDEYVKGEQTYVLKYKFVNVITDFSESFYSTDPYQELYWDTNGNGWYQRFDNITVNLHIDEEIRNKIIPDRELSASTNYKTKSTIHENNKTANRLAAWCYVGTYGASNQDRCEIKDLEDGIQYSAKNLGAYENLTIVLNFRDGTFVVPKNNFINKLNFEDIKIDYYLTRAENGSAKLKVKESFTALFPTLNEYREFPRFIPFVAPSRVRFISEEADDLNLVVTLDGKEVEPYYVTRNNNEGEYEISVRGDTIYLHDEHKVTLEYELSDVIEYTYDKENNVNGQGLSLSALGSKFIYEVSDLNATIHIDEELLSEIIELPYEDELEKEYNLKTFCLDGTVRGYTDRKCEIEETSDGYSFSMTNMKVGEYLSLFINFKDGTFVIPPANKNYLYVHIFVAGMVIIVTIILIFIFRTYRKVYEKIKYLKSLPVIPQYTPIKDITVAEIGKNYLGPTKNLKVATMLELIVNKQISLRREKKSERSKKYNWFVKIEDFSHVSTEQQDLIAILNNGKYIYDDKDMKEEIEVSAHSYSASLEDAFDNYDKHVNRAMKNDDMMEEAAEKKAERKILTKHTKNFNFVLVVIGFLTLLNLFAALAISFVLGFVDAYVEKTHFTKFAIFEGQWLLPILVVIALITATVLPILSIYAEKYRTRTKHGLEISRYTDGLKLYIKMAEADRLKFLQSVEGVDTSEEGIVKLHEKLLPYAALFGLEKSWMKELEKYYELEKVETPTWYASDFSLIAMNSIMRSATSRPIDTSSHSGGGGGGWSSSGSDWSSSSSDSGGGGGGFSGGGGGGGGGGGW